MSKPSRKLSVKKSAIRREYTADRNERHLMQREWYRGSMLISFRLSEQGSDEDESFYISEP